MVGVSAWDDEEVLEMESGESGGGHTTLWIYLMLLGLKIDKAVNFMICISYHNKNCIYIYVCVSVYMYIQCIL